jgi:hypothetical protein
MAADTNEVDRNSAESQSQAETAPSPATTEIRAQIEHTRAEMSETIDAIQARLTPSRLISDAKESVKDATVGRVKRLAATTGNGGGGSMNYERMIDTVRANPIPFAIAGVAATALIARSVMRARRDSGVDAQHYSVPAGEPQTEMSNGSRSATGRLLLGACVAGLACWSAWRANSQAAGAGAPRYSGESNAPVL